nr:hypothetical protein [uncultured Mediterranean phage uvMED]
MKVKTKITYNAAKLANAMPDIIENYIQDSGESTITNARRIIDNKDHEKDWIEKFTIKKRKEGKVGGIKWGDLKYKGDIPLKYTGRLYETMKTTKKGIQLNKYGWLHNQGIDSTVGGEVVKRPKRTFIKFKESEKASKNLEIQLSKNFKK